MEHVWLGSIVTGILFTIGKLYWPSISALQILRLFMGCRLRHLVLLWVSYSSMILFFGAEFTAACKIYTGTVPPSAIKRNRQTVKNIAEFF
jgi:membrane protein